MSSRMQVVSLSCGVRIFSYCNYLGSCITYGIPGSFPRSLLTATLAHVSPVADFRCSSCPLSYDTLFKSVWDAAHRFMICESIDKPYVGELVGFFIALGISTRDWVWIGLIWLSLMFLPCIVWSDLFHQNYALYYFLYSLIIPSPTCFDT
jgi:hypothetical protein